MKKFYVKVTYALILLTLFLRPLNSVAQSCPSISATYITTESRCVATGTVEITATGGSGTYEYKVEGPVITNYTSSNIITGLSAGGYRVYIRDVADNCVFFRDSITIDGDYADPEFSLATTDVTCINGNDGTITVINQRFGRAPFLYRIVAPSASNVGVTSTTGIFTGLISGNYLVQLTDSCGAQQTRSATILDFNWLIQSYKVNKISCDSISVSLVLRDNKGNVSPDSAFNGFTYGASKQPGDTTWFTTDNFTYYMANLHSVKLFARDKCGNTKSVQWTDNAIPNVAAAVSILDRTCNTFTARITGQVNLNSPNYCLYDSANNLIRCDSSGIFTLLPYGNYCIQIINTCYDTTITRCFTALPPQPNVAAAVLITNRDCKTFTASITGQQNLTEPYYCLYDSSGTLLQCDSTGVFNLLPYGSYCIKITDKCVDTVLTRCFTVNQPIPEVAANVSIVTNCNSFTVNISGQQNIFNALYCLYDSANVLIACDSTGIFTNLPFGTYCIHIKNDSTCYDTTIIRCFTVTRPIPSVSPDVLITNLACKTFTAIIQGAVSIYNAQYCLYDANRVLIRCNSTGIFDSLPYGTYCIDVINDPSCYDTTITRCFTVRPPIPAVNGDVAIYNQACKTFSAAITGVTNFTNPRFCILNKQGVQLSCNSTGVFNNLLYGNYCIKVINDSTCYDTTITRCFSVSPPIPAVDTAVVISNKTCTTFTATITGMQNLYNPKYCLYNTTTNTLITCNTIGVFNNVLFGSYCIQIRNDSTCYDTTIMRCFTAAPTPMDMTITTKKSCNTIGTTDLRVKMEAGFPLFVIKLYSPTGALLQSVSTSAMAYTFTSLPALATGLQYKIVVSDACGTSDSGLITPRVSIVKRNITVSPKCPSGIWPDGSADITIDIIDNNIGGSIAPKIIKRNGLPVTINPTTSWGYIYTFLDLGPGIYVIDTYIDECNKHVYDTVTVRLYFYPELSATNAYMCDNNGVRAHVAVAGGRGPFTYEIIGSVPAMPSIITPPQASSIFTVNNGTVYSLIRFRVTDACGNSSLYDANVLPLGNLIVTPFNLQCYNQPFTMMVDSLTGAQFEWYKRILPNDSILIATTSIVTLPNLSYADTGQYFCKVTIGNGCIERYANYVINGNCGGILPNAVVLSGKKTGAGHLLQWKTDVADKSFIVERSTKSSSSYIAIGNVKAQMPGNYTYLDDKPESGANYYRLKTTAANGTVKYTNVVQINNGGFSVGVAPNPVRDVVSITLQGTTSAGYQLQLYNFAAQKIWSATYSNVTSTVIQYQRPAAMAAGIYTLQVTNLRTKEVQTYKLVYR
jgi:hypothetical protein